MVVHRWLILAVLLCLSSCAGSGSENSLDVFAAASLADAMEPLNEAFELKNPGLQVHVQFASSAALREQLLSGAPADVFLSANEGNVQLLVEAAVAKRSSVFATNGLVIAASEGNPAAVSSVDDLQRADLLIGLCVESAPCGAAAGAALAELGISPAVSTREPNAAALRAKLTSAEIDLAVLYASDVTTSAGSIELIAQLPNAVSSKYVAAITGDDEVIGDAYVEFLLSEEGQSMLSDAGFGGAPR